MSGRFAIRTTPLAGLVVLERQVLADHRGYLERLFCADELAGATGGTGIAQINHSLTRRRGTVRGMHFQVAPFAEVKQVTCLRGRVFDVAVDVRPTSPTYLQWHGEVLSADDHRTMLIPEGFAHGFQTLEDNCELLYFHSARHDGPSELSLHPRDPLVSIDWPEIVTEMSPRDASAPMLSRDERRSAR